MLKRIEISGFKSFAKKTVLSFDTPITAIVGPNGSGKSNVVESIRFVLGEQSMKSLRGKGGTDLIWKGSKLLSAGSKARVAISFDNSDRKFAFSSSAGASADLSFDEITLAREVTDSGSDYFINGTGVRLKDINELLGSVNIGASGHHIISQGEADRLLSASAKDRRGMVEDALGLKIYQIRIRDSERKLEKTVANMKEVQALRRELAPHLTFLGKQVEKIQKAEEMRREFADLYNQYASLESGAIAYAEKHLNKEEETIRKELSGLAEVSINEAAEKNDRERSSAHEEIRSIEGDINRLTREREELGRAIGRIEGKLDALTSVKEVSGATVVEAESVKTLCREIMDIIDHAGNMGELSEVRSVLSDMRGKIQSFTDSLKGEAPKTDTEGMRAEIEKERESLESRLKGMDERIEEAQKKLSDSREKLSKIEQSSREAERTSYAGAARRATLEGMIRECALRRENLNRRTFVFDEGKKEAEALLGTMFSLHIGEAQEDTPERAAEREGLYRKLERIKIKLEDAGAASGAEILKEYEDTQTRDAFLARELVDIEASMATLKDLIHELRDTIERTFKEGIEKINKEFGSFFKLMFGGGSAFLSIIVEHKRARGEEDEEGGGADDDALPFEHGIEINVNLPHKKVRDLNMLSGGERSLISIALLFAMSQVNPPPFLVLDETDAALDEANSRKYGDMLEHLSAHSKLIVVTHNRETMSRAQVLYGVTMGLEGASKLLSIKFEEAVQIAK